MLTLTFPVALAFFGLVLAQDPAPQPTRKTASDEAREEAKDRTRKGATAGAAAGAAGQAIMGNPLAGGMSFLTGALGAEIQARVASSQWAMSGLQRGAAEGIQKHLSKRDKEPYTITNSKVDGLMVLTIKAAGMTHERSEAMLKEEPLWKWRKCGWDRLVFANDTEAWAVSTEEPKSAK